MVSELPWHGRRIDLVTLSPRRVASSFELKLGSVGRALEQAIYNTLSFDHSWAVIDRSPSAEMLRLAAVYGVGIIVADRRARVILPARQTDLDRDVREQLVAKIRRTELA